MFSPLNVDGVSDGETEDPKNTQDLKTAGVKDITREES